MTCKLCQRDLLLKNSHFLPKNVYKRFSELVAPGKFLMMAQQGKSFKMGPHITQYLLCEECEKRFNKNGEDYFAKMAMPKFGDALPPALYRILYNSLIPLWNHQGVNRFSLGSGFFSKIRSDHIFYFAISMFWRGGLEGWRGYQHVVYDDDLMDAMRRFLLGHDCLSGHVVRVVPSFWAGKYGATLPIKHQGIPFFSIYMYDFYLEKLPAGVRGYASRSNSSIMYTADSSTSAISHLATTTAINSNQRAMNFPATGNLVSWGLDSSTNQTK